MRQPESLQAALARVQHHVGGRGRRRSSSGARQQQQQQQQQQQGGGGGGGGGLAAAAAGAGGGRDACVISDDDDGDEPDVQLGNTVVSLKDPNAFVRIATPARFADVGDVNAFDLEHFLSLAERTHKWLDPHSMRASTVQQLQVRCARGAWAGACAHRRQAPACRHALAS
jgi:hypothetical protein